MTEFVQITTTTGKRQDAEQIASELVSRRLAGCVQVSGPIVSTFRWQGKVETAEEWMCVIKTSRAQLAAIRGRVRSKSIRTKCQKSSRRQSSMAATRISNGWANKWASSLGDVWTIYIAYAAGGAD